QYHNVHGSIKYLFTEHVSAGTSGSFYTNAGSFALDLWTINCWVKYAFDNGVYTKFKYEHNDYNEDNQSYDDYSADVYTIKMGYSF
ncbi:MAG: hypothetical protein Q8Q33_05870, partial [Chlamydiota bacterium]|nr:hypothetical protein [Chlamydiota bacterium]